MKQILFLGTLFLLARCTSPDNPADKTLLAWVMVNDMDVSGGSFISVHDGKHYDGLIFSEEEGGSLRIVSEEERLIAEKSDNDEVAPVNVGELVQIAAVYDGPEVRLYHNGEPYAVYKGENRDLLGSKDNHVIFGRYRMGFGGDHLSAALEDARIYDQALTAEQLRELQPNQPSEIEPYAWWDFEGEELAERTGRYTYHNTGEGDVELQDGKLLLSEWGRLAVTREYEPETPRWPEDPPEDWFTFHLAHPGPGVAEPGDPNPAYFYKGRYHLHYIYENQYGIAYAHVSSTDMVHWKWHPTVLIPPITGHGMYSGTGFFTQEGQPAMIYHGVGSGRNFLTFALDDYLDEWTKPEVVMPVDEQGKGVDRIDYWDPDAWRNGDTYYALSGGEDPELMRSEDLKNWEYLGKLLHEGYPDGLGVSRGEDISCANMFQIGNEWMLLCISHELGCRYFLGGFKEEKYLPEYHALMNWKPVDWEEGVDEEVVYFAPESLLTEDGRRVMWAWLVGEWPVTGLQSLPRELELPEDGVLRIRPLRELESLRYDEVAEKNITVDDSQAYELPDIAGNAVELEVTFQAPLPEEFGIYLLADEQGEGGLRITAGKSRESLKIGLIEPPFELEDGENMKLRVFIDKGLVEVFANDRQAAAYRHVPIRESVNIRFFTRDAELLISELKAWKMRSIYEGDTVFRK